VALVLRSNERAKASLTLTIDHATARKLKLRRNAKRRVTVGRARRVVASGRSAVVVRLTAGARKAIRQTRRLRLLVTVTLTDGSGNAATRRRTVTLVR
jgi:hypothetical protein